MGAPFFISNIDLHRGIPSMSFPRPLNTGKMAKYVAYHFEWDRCGVGFPLLTLPNNFQALCPSYELAVAKEIARRFELPELPQVIFYMCFLTKRRGWGSCRIVRIMESTLTELRWSTFELWVWLNRDQIFEARFREKAKHEEESSDVERVASSSDDDEQGKVGQEEVVFPSDDDKQE